MITKNNKGEYALYDQGKLLGYEPVVQIQGVRVLRSMAPMLLKMIEAAQHDGVNLTLAAGLRTWEEQYNLRKQNEKPDLYLQWQVDSKLVDHETYLTKADSKYFRPATGKPGWSNHQDGKAYDFNVTGYPEVYKWLGVLCYGLYLKWGQWLAFIVCGAVLMVIGYLTGDK